MHIRRAGNAGNLFRQLLRDFIIRCGVAPGHLHVDGRRQAEIQNLIGDIGRFEKHHQIGESFVQPLAELLGIDLSGGVLRLQGNQDFAVAHADGRTVAESQIEAAIRQADIVENGIQLARSNHAAYLILDIGEDHLRTFDTGAGWSSRMQPDLPGINGGEEIAAHQVHQAERSKRKNQEAGEHRGRGDPEPNPAARRKPTEIARSSD